MIKHISLKKYTDDNYIVLDDSFFDITLTNISIKELQRQYVDFETLITLPPLIGDPLFNHNKLRRVNEGVNKTYNIDKVQKSIKRKYELANWQFVIKQAGNDIKVALVIPHIHNNEKSVIDDMKSLGYYECNRWHINRADMNYTVIRFDPLFLTDITELMQFPK